MNDSSVHYTKITEITYEEYFKASKEVIKSDNKNISQELSSINDIQSNEIQHIVSMKWYEELCVILLLLFGVPGSVLSIPIVILVTGYFIGSFTIVIVISLVLLVPLAFIPSPFVEESLYSWISFQVLRYFSFKAFYVEKLNDHVPRILVAPPHGLFPFGNILTMMAFPCVMGYSFYGLASSVALNTPIFKNLLGCIGAIDASRTSAMKALEKGEL